MVQGLMMDLEINAKGQNVAGRYAVAFYDYVFERKALDSVIGQVKALVRLIQESPELRLVLGNPTVEASIALTIVVKAIKEVGIGAEIQNFISVVASNRRLNKLYDFLIQFLQLVSAHRGVVTVTVTTAQPLTKSYRQRLELKLRDMGYTRIALEEYVNPMLLGGMVVQLGPYQFDASIKSRLIRLHNAMKGTA